ncbi:MAG: hypothetical protein HFE29_02330 [Clostridia bacterium]|jgi:uncharacterized membrane protein HdeD (DUF308 family)|nr:hypothetical protein [Clostridia bacterium]
MANSNSNNLSTITSSPLISGIALIILGILFCALRSGFVSILLTIVGVVLIILGALALVGKNWAMGLIEVSVGIIIIACGWTIVDVTLLILGIAFIAYAIYQLILAIPKFKGKKPAEILLAILNPLILMILGIILVVAKWQMIDAIFIVIGVVAIVAGAIMIMRDLFSNKQA